MIIRTYHVFSDEDGDEGPHIGHETGEGETSGAKGGGEQLRGVHEQDLHW